MRDSKATLCDLDMTQPTRAVFGSWKETIRIWGPLMLIEHPEAALSIGAEARRYGIPGVRSKADVSIALEDFVRLSRALEAQGVALEGYPSWFELVLADEES